ncbi:MAG: efflux RND transporter periplasmic adaptor subunit, partial [Candidatus Sericytochromatia bacterium]
EGEAAAIRPGAPVSVGLGVGAPIAGTVAHVVPAVDPASRTAIAKIALPEDARVRSGMTGRARFTMGQAERLLMPESAVVRWYHLTSAYVVDSEQKARLRLVRLGRAEGARREVLAGLSPGDRVVVAGQAGLEDGQIVEVQP